MYLTKLCQGLEDTRREALRKYADISQWYTRPSNELGKPPSHKYTLRGVSAVNDTTYVLQRTRTLGSGEFLDHRAEEWQWWKLSFAQGQAQPVSQTVSPPGLELEPDVWYRPHCLLAYLLPQRIREIEALKAARDDSNSALLVYASEKAVTLESSNLPSQLKV